MKMSPLTYQLNCTIWRVGVQFSTLFTQQMPRFLHNPKYYSSFVVKIIRDFEGLAYVSVNRKNTYTYKYIYIYLDRYTQQEKVAKTLELDTFVCFLFRSTSQQPDDKSEAVRLVLAWRLPSCVSTSMQKEALRPIMMHGTRAHCNNLMPLACVIIRIFTIMNFIENVQKAQLQERGLGLMKTLISFTAVK